MERTVTVPDSADVIVTAVCRRKFCYPSVSFKNRNCSVTKTEKKNVSVLKKSRLFTISTFRVHLS